MGGQGRHWRWSRSRPRRRPIAALAVNLVLLAGLAACAVSRPGSGGGSDDATPHQSGSPSADGDPTTAVDRSTAASPTTRPVPSPGTPRTHQPAALSFAAFWAARSGLVEHSVTVDATLRFDLVCPPPDSPAGCVASAYLAADGTNLLPPHPEEQAIRLYDRGKPVGCAATSITDLSCQGWREGTPYRVTGVPRHPQAQGRQLPGLIFDATAHTTR